MMPPEWTDTKSKDIHPIIGWPKWRKRFAERTFDAGEGKPMSKWMALLWQSLVNARPAGQTPGLDCDRRQTPRFPSALQVSCRPVTAADSSSLPVRMRDISAGGIGLDSPRFFEPDTLLEIERLDPSGRAAVRVISCVRHARQTGDTWALGCSFIRDLDDSELGAFEPSL